jgi:hypothetical protein
MVWVKYCISLRDYDPLEIEPSELENQHFKEVNRL